MYFPLKCWVDQQKMLNAPAKILSAPSSTLKIMLLMRENCLFFFFFLTRINFTMTPIQAVVAFVVRKRQQGKNP